METITISIPNWVMIFLIIAFSIYVLVIIISKFIVTFHEVRTIRELMKQDILEQVDNAVREQVSFDDNDEGNNFVIDLMENINERVKRI